MVLGLTACGKDGVKVKSANALGRKLSNSSNAKINVTEELALEEPIVITGEKEIVGEGTITAAMKGSEEVYMITVAEGGKLTIGGSVKIDAASLMGAVHVQDGGSVVVKGKAVVKNASEAAANALVEGSLEVKGGNLKGAKGHNIINKNTTTISGGKVTGSGDKYAGIYNEATLTQNGGKVSAAYNNISNLKGATFTFEGGTNENSIRDGVFVAEGATLKATNKDATIVNAGARGILLQGQADIKVITVKECGDSLVKVTKTGVLNLGNGVLQGGNYHGVDNAGSMNMLGGNISLNANCGIVNTGTLKVMSGNISENANKGILNKHQGKADVTSAMVTFTSNKTAIANEDKAVFEFAKAKLLMSTQTNIYCYDGTMNIHDASLNASTSNNIRIVDGVINMANVEVKGNSQKSNTSHHGIYMEGGVINAENVTVSMTTGHGIRNKGGVFKGKNIIMHDINRVAVSQAKHDYLEDVEGLIEIEGLEIQSTNYANVYNEGGGIVKITNAKLAVASSNSVRSNDGKTELTNVTIPGHKEGSKDNIHGIYLEGGEIIAKNVTIQDTSGNALRNKNGKFVGKNIKMTNVKGQSAIWNLPLSDEEKNGIIDIDGLTVKNSASKNITLDCGVTIIKNAVLGKTGANNIKMQNNAATLKLYDVKIEGQIEDATANTHGIMVEGGNVYGEKVQIADTKASGIRCKMGKVDLKDVTMTNLGQAGISNSKMTKDGELKGVGHLTIDGLTITKAGTNNVVLDAGTVTIKNGVLGKVETNNHNTKVSGTGVLTMKNVKVEGTSNSSKYGIIAEGGDAILEDVQIYDLARSGIHANKATSEVTGKNITISNGVFGVTGSNGSITIDGLTTSNISDNNVLADNLLKVTLKNSTLGETTGHNVKATGDAIVSLKKTEILGVTDGSKHGVMAEGGDVELTNVTISNVKNTAIRINKATSKVTGENVTITNSGNGVTGTNGKVVINGLTTTGITGNNVVSDGGANFTIKNGDLCQVTGDAHNVKVTGSSNLKMTDTVVRGTTSDSKYGIIAEGGDAVLKNVEFYDLAKSAIHANKETSKVTGENITIARGVAGITGSAGTIELKKVKTSELSDNNITISGTCVVTVTKSTGGYGLGVTNGHSVKVVDNAVVNLDTVEIEGVTATDKHGVMAEGGDVVLNNVLIHDVANSAIRINKPTSEVTGTKVVIKDSNNAVSGSDGTVTIDGLTTSGISNNNVLVSGSSDEAGCVVTITNGNLGWTAGHNVKAETYGKVYLKDTELNGVVSAGKYGVMAEGGYANLDNVKIKAVTEAAIRSNKDTSVVEGTDVTITKSGVGVSVSAGNVTLNELKSTATTSNVTVSGGETIITNSSLNKTGDSNAVVSGGVLKLDDVDVNGTSANYGVLVTAGKLEVKPNVTVKDTAAEGVYNQGGTIEGNQLTIQNTGATALHNTNGGKTTFTNLKVSGTKSVYNIWNEGENSSVSVDGGELGKSASNNVVAAGGTVTLKNIDVNGTGGKASNNIHGVLASGGDVVLENVGITGAATAGIRVNNAASTVSGNNIEIKSCYTGISTNYGETVINGLTTSGMTDSNIAATDYAKVTVNKYANGDKSVLGKTGGHNVKSEGDNKECLVTLNDVEMQGSSSSAHYTVIAQGGDVALTNATLNGASAKAAIRVNRASSSVMGTNVTIKDVAMGITASAGEVNIAELTSSATNTNVVTEGATVTLTGKTLSSTAKDNIQVTSGTLTLDNVAVNGSTGGCGIHITGGTVYAKNKLTVKDTLEQGIYLEGGTFDALEDGVNAEVTVQNTGRTDKDANRKSGIYNKGGIFDVKKLYVNNTSGEGVVNANGGQITLDYVEVEGVDRWYTVKNTGAGSQFTINGGELKQSQSHNVCAENGTLTLNNVIISGTQSNHGVYATKGTVILNRVQINDSAVAGIRINDVDAKVTGTGVTINGGNYGIWGSTGTVDIVDLDISNIKSNNIITDNECTIRVNTPADGSNVADGVTNEFKTTKDSHNVRANGKGHVYLANMKITNETSGSYAIIADNAVGYVDLANVIIESTNEKAAIRTNNASNIVKGTNLTVNAAEGISNGGSTVELNQYDASGVSANKHGIWNDGTLKVSGTIKSTIYMNKAETLNAVGALTGSQIKIDWAKNADDSLRIPTDLVAIQFANETDATEMQNSITLGANVGDKYTAYFFKDQMLLNDKTNLQFTVRNYKELTDTMAAIETQDASKATITIAGDIEVTAEIVIKAGRNIDLVDDGNARTIIRSASYQGDLFNVEEGATLTLRSTGTNEAPKLLVDGGSTKQNPIITEAGSSFVNNNGTLIVESGVQFANVLGSATKGANTRSLAIAAGTTSVTEFKGVLRNFVGQDCNYDIAFTVNKTQGYTIEDALIEDNYTPGEGIIRLEGGGQLTIKNSVFRRNNAAKKAGVVSESGNVNNKLTVEGCTFENNSAVQNGGVFDVNCSTIGNVVLRNSTFKNNSAYEGGAINMVTGAHITLVDCEFMGNTTSRVETKESKCGFGDIRLGGNHEKGGITISGKMIVDIYMNQAGKINIAGALAEGSKVVANWRIGKVDAAIKGASWDGILFANNDDMNASKDFIELSSNTNNTYALTFANAKGTLVKLEKATNQAELQEKLTAAASAGNTVYIGISSDMEISSTVSVPNGANVVLINDGTTRTIKRAATLTSKHMIEVASGATLTITSTGENTTPALYIDGGSKSNPQVVTTGYTSLIHNIGTLSVESGVEITNVISATTYGRGYGILADKNTTTTFEGKITSIEGRGGDRGIAAVVMTGAEFTFDNAIVENNKTNGRSAVYVEGGGHVNAKNSVFRNNSADVEGGVFSDSGNASNKIIVENCVFENNSSGNGGVFFIRCTTANNMKITDSTFTGNSATNGGVLYNEGKITFIGTDDKVATFKNNTASKWGGAIYANKGNLDVNGYVFETNSAQAGGAILLFSTATVKNTTFTGNHTNVTGGFEGGAIYVNNNATFENCIFDANSAKTNGGAICMSGDAKTITLSGTNGAVFTNNKAGGVGGAIYLFKGILNGSGYTFTNNTPENISRNTYYSAENNLGIVDVTFNKK